MDFKEADVGGVAALAKGLTLLNLILQDRGRSRIAVLAADLALPRSTLHRLLAELKRQGLVLRVARGRYDAGLSIARASPGLTVNAQLASAAREPLRRLAAACGLTAHLGVYESEMVTYLVKAPSQQSSVQFTRENGQLEAYCSGIGKVLLAHLPSAERDLYLAGGPFVALTRRTITDVVRLATCLAEVRAQGYATDEEEIAMGLRCLAVPVLTHRKQFVAAISVAGVKVGSPAAEPSLLAQIRACAREIESNLDD